MPYKVINQSEKQEQEHLERIKERLEKSINRIDTEVSSYARDVQESKDYLWENKAGMDHAEKVSVRQSISQIAMTGESAVARKRRLARLINTPWFGRIDFSERGDPEVNPLYIGIHSFFDHNQNINLIHDWRAPVSGMFYDFELGEAFYEAPSGKVEGEIKLKRQYRIRDGKMEFMLESSLNILDDVLQKELSQNSSEKMKNIVATIQRDQNAIIRNEESRVLIIQGVAGSGKTSIALHRVAFLLYRFKETINSEDILIISPNKVFADYISNVLPELGEEKIQETSMEELAHDLLDNKFRFQTFFEQIALLTEKDDKKFQERIKFKSGHDFIARLNEFLVYIENEYFKPVNFFVKRYPVPAVYLEEKFKTYHRLPLFKRVQIIVHDIVKDLNYYNQYEVTAADRNHIKKEIENMFRTLNLRKLYKDFYQWMDKPDMLKMAKGSAFEYSDVFPLIYLKIQLEGIKSIEKVKHLVIDEMQDYTPLQYNILGKLFPCNKTILGDSNQSVNPFSSSDSESVSKAYPNADCLTMLKSYRSTMEISRFAQKIRFNRGLEVIERYGEEPSIRKCKNAADEIQEIRKLINGFSETTHKSLGIICKTQSQADHLYEKLKDDHAQLHLLNSQSTSFSNGVVISTAYMVKGLEFDSIIVPFASSGNYKTEIDRQMLYVACTRAMHKLNLTFTGNQTDFIPG
jgi:DNA helicase II / ATP-dependent DNA helicase PcrA